jgi:hypothetical protein
MRIPSLEAVGPFCAFLAWLAAPAAFAAVPHETFYFEGTPTPDQVSLWSSYPGTRSYTINAGDASGQLLQPLGLLKNADRIQVEVENYPTQDSLSDWKDLASQGIQLVILGKAGLPTDDEAKLLNETGFERCLFVLSYFPDEADSRKLAGLKCHVSLTFAMAAYPKYEDKPGLAAIPETIPLLFASDYWPSYSHMDVFNMLPHAKSLRVLGMLPPDEQLQYLRGIKNLASVQLNLEFDPQSGDWSKFDGLALTWTSLGHVPAQEALESFARGDGRSPRKLIVDSDTPLTDEERARIEASPVAVEWIHQAPDSRSGSRCR